jgi:hypothetical protein
VERLAVNGARVGVGAGLRREEHLLAVVVALHAALLADERLDARHVELALGEHGAALLGRHLGVGRHVGDDVMDVALDVDAGRVAQLVTAALLFWRLQPLDVLAELRVHQLLHVGERHHHGVPRDVTQLLGAGLLREGARDAAIVRHQAAGQAYDQECDRTDEKIARPFCHSRRSPARIYGPALAEVPG